MRIRNKKGQFTSEGMIGKNNPKWRGNKVGYWGVHSWIYRRLGDPKLCMECGGNKNVQWANKSHKYKREVCDWISLCFVCHRKYDGITKLTKKDAEDIRNKLLKGIKQVVLAVEYKVDQGTISNIFHRKAQYYG